MPPLLLTFLSPYARTTPCPVVRSYLAMPMQPTVRLAGADPHNSTLQVALPYAKSGTMIAWAAHRCYAMRGTDLGYAATRSK
eukprot:3776769-Rhodomonas_salina.2